MLLLHRWQRLFFALLVFTPSQAKGEPDQPGQTDVELTGKELAQLVYDRENGDDSCAHSVMGLISRRGKKRICHFITYRKDDGKLLKQLIRFTLPADIDVCIKMWF
jgi:hypothetical protein